MSKKVVVVGGVAGGMSVAARVRRLDEQAEIVVFERGRHVSFSNCALPFHLSGMIPRAEQLVLMTPELLRKRHAIDARVRHEVVDIDRAARTVTVHNLDSDETFEEEYDVLVLSPGAVPIRPDIPGATAEHVFTVRDVTDIDHIKRHVDQPHVTDVVVVGGGYIGLEMAENLKHAGKNVTVVEMRDQVLTRLDEDIVQLLHHELLDQGVRLVLNDALTKIGEAGVTVASGTTVPAQAVILAIGVRPETTLAQQVGLKIGDTGAIWVDRHYRTSDSAIYAVGDAIEVFNQLTHKPSRLAMAGPAQRQARAAADHIYGVSQRQTGVIGSSVVRVFSLTAASTGLNEAECIQEHMSYDKAYVIGQDKVNLMPDSKPMHLKLLFEVPTGRILGAQAVGVGNVEKRIDVIATLIMMGGTLEDMRDLELCYSPLYSTAKDVVNNAALVALNVLNQEVHQVTVGDLRRLIVEEDAFVIDVREPVEWERGHIKGAVNIPMSQFRDRLDEIPKDRPVYCHCRIGQRSYNVVRALNQLGFPNAVNIGGSYLGFSHHEYFHDVADDRESLVTEYNFR
ncbi:FAD-dependent oxidoreductase [Actinotalea sp. M2MS4P-6]|uniref:FAD-dependent oxidoreductase n=1 Tax=Actinotalea sp. M2MS4P-6 TaxID=2983762 RepID=UPI0021E48D89|nr:FAD-dependent oxidoreductase [Actinotalea sp. M2MS4P-6]MCV2392877.1 FAD-dependent oxidoreductase [Actinotalea sp. M2MS4P-6]